MPPNPSASSASLESALRNLHRFCVTEGELIPERQGALHCKAAKMRAVLGGTKGDRAKLRFQYLGPSAEMKRLGSGLERRQIGLKLKARDPCNLLYVMWRIVPESKVVVSFKSNPDAATSAECGNAGYTNLPPTQSATPPLLEPGAEHELSAEIAGSMLHVRIDGSTVWEGALPEEVLALEGSAGVRSDNVEWKMAHFDAGPEGALGACRRGAGD